MMKNLWNDEAGFTVALELILVATILVIGLVAGLSALRTAVITELADLGTAIGSINQTYSVGFSSDGCSGTPCWGITDTNESVGVTVCTCATTPAPAP